MLEKLLELLAKGSVYRVEDLARELDVSRDMAERMLDDLVRMGYLKPVALGCDQGCTGCPYAGACAVTAGQQIWALTDKGRSRLAAKERAK